MQGLHGRSLSLKEARAAVRVRHYSIRTEQACLNWIGRFIVFHGKGKPGKMPEADVVAFLTHLAVERGVAPAT